MRLLEGEVESGADARIAELEEELRETRASLSAANREVQQAKNEGARALAALRRQLSPLYRALQAVFGELDAAGTDDTSSATAPDSRTAAIWNAWKTRLGGQCAKVIDALLVQTDMNTTQLAIAIGTHRNNIPNLIFKLNKAGLINKSGGRFSLKSL